MKEKQVIYWSYAIQKYPIVPLKMISSQLKLKLKC